MSSGSGVERTSQGKRSANSQISSDVGLPVTAQAKKQKGDGQGGSAFTDDELTHSGEHICVSIQNMKLLFYRQNHSNSFTLGDNLKTLNIKYS